MSDAATSKVWLVGAGPGDPELLTLRAVRVLGGADVVLCDDLVDRRVLAHVRPGARILHVGKRGGRTSTDQRFIDRVMVREAQRGLRVVRLKGGDPFMFGRGGEECDALRAAGVAVEVVPGITAGIAAPAAIGVPVTDRRHGSGVVFVTGQNGTGGRAASWAALAQSGLTLVVYMGIANCASIAAELVAAGLSPETPAAAVSGAHTSRQRHVACTLATLAEAVAREAIVSPAILVVGGVAGLAQALALSEPPVLGTAGQRSAFG